MLQMDIRTHIDNNGRLLIPAELRKKYNLNVGDAVVIRIIDNEIKLVNMKQMISEVQDIVRKYVPKDVSLVEELRKMREEELALETKELDRYGKPEKNKGEISE
jgi:AbrB family looped-hinge helix DNA binding protein